MSVLQLFFRNESKLILPLKHFFHRVRSLRRLESQSAKSRFASGTSDESDGEDTNDDDDLQKLFCPLTDSNGSPYNADDEMMGEAGFAGEQVSMKLGNFYSERRICLGRNWAFQKCKMYTKPCALQYVIV